MKMRGEYKRIRNWVEPLSSRLNCWQNTPPSILLRRTGPTPSPSSQKRLKLISLWVKRDLWVIPQAKQPHPTTLQPHYVRMPKYAYLSSLLTRRIADEHHLGPAIGPRRYTEAFQDPHGQIYHLRSIHIPHHVPSSEEHCLTLKIKNMWADFHCESLEGYRNARNIGGLYVLGSRCSGMGSG